MSSARRTYPASLGIRKFPDADTTTHGLIRVVDESEEDYLYPSDYFLSIDLTQSTHEALFLKA